MIVWDPGLPQIPQQAGFEEQKPNVTVRTEMSTGPAKVRRRSTTNVTKFKMTFQMTASQVNIFDVFFNTTVAGGALSFSFPDPRSGIIGNFRFDLSNGLPSITALSGETYNVSCSMELLP